MARSICLGTADVDGHNKQSIRLLDKVYRCLVACLSDSSIVWLDRSGWNLIIWEPFVRFKLKLLSGKVQVETEFLFLDSVWFAPERKCQHTCVWDANLGVFFSPAAKQRQNLRPVNGRQMITGHHWGFNGWSPITDNWLALFCCRQTLWITWPESNRGHPKHPHSVCADRPSLKNAQVFFDSEISKGIHLQWRSSIYRIVEIAEKAEIEFSWTSPLDSEGLLKSTFSMWRVDDPMVS